MKNRDEFMEVRETAGKTATQLMLAKGALHLRKYLKGELDEVSWTDEEKITLITACLFREDGKETDYVTSLATSFAAHHIGGLEKVKAYPPASFLPEFAKKLKDFDATVLLFTFMLDIQKDTSAESVEDSAQVKNVKVFTEDGTEVTGEEKEQILSELSDFIGGLK